MQGDGTIPSPYCFFVGRSYHVLVSHRLYQSFVMRGNERMHRTNYRRRRVERSLHRFFTENRRLLLYLFCLIIGIALGLTLSPASAGDWLSSIMEIRPISGSVAQAVWQVFSSCFLVEALVVLMFVSGLSACGAPVTILVPVFYGLGLGLSQAYWGAQGAQGLLLSAVLIWPHSLVEMLALLMGCCESLRMSLLLAAQLLPGGTIGGLWHDFKLYLSRFLLFSVIALTAGIVDVLLRVVFSSLL